MMFNFNSSQIPPTPQLPNKWAAEFPNNKKVLLVGEGDMGFAKGLATSRPDALKIIATSFQSYDDVVTKYHNGAENVGYLLTRKAKVVFQVDATVMMTHPKLIDRRFDVIVFNFPHAGFTGSETNMVVVEAHKTLMRLFFKNAATMLTRQGEVHVTHQTNHPYDKWELPELATDAGLMHIDTCPFDIKDYAGYENKRGSGRHADKSFKLGEAAKFKFKMLI